MRLFQLVQIWLGLWEFIQMFIIYANLNEPQFTQMVPNVPKFEWSCFNHPNWIEVVGIYPNVSNSIQISMKNLYIAQIRLKLFEVAQIEWIWPKFEWSYWHLPKVYLVCWNLPKNETPFLRRRTLVRLTLPVVRVKLRLSTISVIMRTMCLSGSRRSSLQMRPWYHTVS